MPTVPLPLRRVGRILVGHVRRLRSLLEQLAGQVRAAVAQVVGQATGDAVRDAVRVILDGPHVRGSGPDPPPSREALWGQPRRPSWSSNSYGGYDPYEDPDRDPAFDADAIDDLDDEPSPAAPTEQPPGRWSRAVGAGCQAAGWWLRHHPGMLSLPAALAVGIAAGFAALVGGPLVAGGSAAALSALGVVSLAHAAQAAAGLAAEAVT
jgi:hypothetical protein